jgi:TM2 domain-containing membrane protein YozV
MTNETSSQSQATAYLLCLFFGLLGIHRFYLGKRMTGLLQMLTFGGFGLWLLVDWFMILFGQVRDKQGRRFKQRVS